MDFIRSRTLWLGCLALAAVLSLSATHRSPVVNSPDIILITVDSLRADALGVYGYGKPTSPHLDAFAREAVVITDAVAQAPYTKPSIASLMTGVFPGTHKTYTSSKPAETIMKRGGHVKGAFELTDALPKELPTLAEAMTAAGYRTVGLSTNPFLISDFGYDRGFSEFEFFSSGETYARATPVLERALQVLKAPRSRPVFIWIHLMDTHNPYLPSEPYRSMFRPATPPRLIPEAAIDPAARLENSRDVNVYRARYDACVREVDDRLGRFFEELRAAGVWGHAAVVVTADHGEEFFEHSRMGHNTDLFDEQLRIPLIAKLPGVRPGRLSMVAQLVDLFPTLIHLAGGTIPSSHGADLLAAIAQHEPVEGAGFSELPGRGLWAVRTQSWKLISGMPGTGKLYDLQRDARETRNVMADRSNDARQLQQALSAMISTELRDARRVSHREVQVDPKVVDQLRALGYLGKQ
ncbi:MAG: sulfatase [Bacteroidales bacterium]